MVILPMVCSMVPVVSVPEPIGGANPLVEGVAGVALLVVVIFAPIVVGTAPSFSSVNIISGSLAGGMYLSLLDPDFSHIKTKPVFYFFYVFVHLRVSKSSSSVLL